MRSLKSAFLFSCLCALTIAQGYGTTYPSGKAGDGKASDSLPSEKVFVHTDRSIYISGEHIWFKVLCLDAASLLPEDLSQAAYVEVLNNENQQVIAQVIRLVKGSGNGMIEIPGNLVSGIYYLRVYTAWMKNFNPALYFLKPLKIFNPFQPVTEDRSAPPLSTEITIEKPLPGSVQPVIENLMPEYKNRDKVNIILKMDRTQGVIISTDLSIAVVLDNETKPVHDPSILSFLSGSPATVIDSGLYTLNSNPDSVLLPELEGLVLSGSLRNKDNNDPGVNKPVYFSWVGGNRDVKRTYTNPAGRFYFKIPEAEGKKQVIIQAPESSNGSYLIMDGQFSRRYFKVKPLRFDLSEYPGSYIEQLLMNYQVAKAYKTNDTKYLSRNEMPDFYGTPNGIYTLENYIKLPVMEEFFHELVKSTLLVKEKRAYKINVLDGNLNRIIGPDPGYLIDGVPVFHSSLILESDPQVFRDIRVVNSRYFYGDLYWDGLVDLSTRAGDFRDFELPAVALRQSVQMFEPGKQFVPVNYNTAETYTSRLPDYRTLLFWKPDLTTDAEGKAGIEFTTSDASGIYKIVIQGITSGGQPVYFEKRFWVGKH